MPFSQLPASLSAWLAYLCGTLHRRSAPRLLRLLLGALFARGRRTVTSWFRAAGITTDFRRAYGALWAGAGPGSGGPCRPTARSRSTWPSGPGSSAAGRR